MVQFNIGCVTRLDDIFVSWKDGYQEWHQVYRLCPWNRCCWFQKWWKVEARRDGSTVQKFWKSNGLFLFDDWHMCVNGSFWTRWVALLCGCNGDNEWMAQHSKTLVMNEWSNTKKHWWWWMNDPTFKNTGDDERMTQHSKTFFVLLLAENKFGMSYHWTLACSLTSMFRFQRCVFEAHRWDDSCVSSANISWLMECLSMRSVRGEVYNMNKTRPHKDPWGTFGEDKWVPVSYT